MATLAAASLAGDHPQHVELIGEDPALDGVVVAQAPFYNAIHFGSEGVGGRLGGVVEVEVQIDSTGAVVGTSIVSHPKLPLLPAWAEQAVCGWRFEPSPGSWTRHVILTFSFEGALSEAKPRGVLARYESPLTIHVQYVEPTVFFLDRVDGRIPDRTCELHHVPMVVELIPMTYGLPAGLEPHSREAVAQSRWSRARKRRFPNAPLRVGGSCMVRTEKQAEAYICPKCRDARDQWLAKHRRFVPIW